MIQPGVNVKGLYEALVAQGYDKKAAAKEAQARTGVSVVTGRPFKPKSLKPKKYPTKFGGQYGQ